MWLGAGLASMQIGRMLQGADREGSVLLLSVMGRVHRAMLLPGVVLTILTGLLLTLRLYGGPISTTGYPIPLMVMQGAGVIGGAIAIGVTFPAVTRLMRLDPTGPHAAAFASLRTRAAMSGMIAGMLGMIALLAAALLR